MFFGINVNILEIVISKDMVFCIIMCVLLCCWIWLLMVSEKVNVCILVILFMGVNVLIG